MTEYEKLSLMMLRNIQRTVGNMLVMMATDDLEQRVKFITDLENWLATFPQLSDEVDRAVAAKPRRKRAKKRKKK